MPLIEGYLMKRGGNQAISINVPTSADFHITTNGSDWLWAAFSVFMFVSLTFHGAMFRKPVKERIFYITTAIATYSLSIAYFSYASDLGWAPVRAEFNHVTINDQDLYPGYRQVFYAKFIGWFCAFPCIVINLCLLSKTPLLQTFFTVIFTELFVVGTLVGSIIHSTYKWGYYVFALVGYFATVLNLVTTSRNCAKEVGRDVHVYFNYLASIFSFLWFIYPIAWGLCEGGNVIQPDSEAVFYGVLDVLTFGFYPFAFFYCAKDVALERLGLSTPEYEVGHTEKSAAILSARASGDTAIHNSASLSPLPEPASPAVEV